MADSILDSVKKALGVEPDYTEFDSDILMYINSVFSTLQQLGIGPEIGFYVEDAVARWEDFLPDDVVARGSVRTYVTLRVRMIFDPPTTSYHTNAMAEQIKELEWRLNVHREKDMWVDPEPDLPRGVILDGGAP